MRIAWHGMYPEEDKFVLNCLCLSESNKIWKEPREIGEIIGYLIILAQSSDEYPNCNCWPSNGNFRTFFLMVGDILK